jgi:predicted nucleic-acid-binding Zn-ribbon protein
MDKNKLKEVIDALNRRNVNQACPRCASNNFSVIGESEITVTQPPVSFGLLGSLSPAKTTMPIIVITCDNCGFVSQHAQFKLLPPKLGASNRSIEEGLGLLRTFKE